MHLFLLDHLCGSKRVLLSQRPVKAGLSAEFIPVHPEYTVVYSQSKQTTDIGHRGNRTLLSKQGQRRGKTSAEKGVTQTTRVIPPPSLFT